jgi:hypothetical protein
MAWGLDINSGDRRKIVAPAPSGPRCMPLDRPQGSRWPEPLAGRLDPDAGIEQVASAIMAIWREIEAALGPIIGRRGVAALFHRSLRLASSQYPWLLAGGGDALDAVDIDALEAALRQQSAIIAAAAGAVLFQSVHDLLASLVGATLTSRLLHSVWAPTTGATPAQDSLP